MTTIRRLRALATKATRVWRSSEPFRRKFGLLRGIPLALRFRDHYKLAAGADVVIRTPGWARPIHLRAGTSDAAVYRQLILDGELNLDLEPQPMRIIDAGANIGLATLVFQGRWPSAEIVSVELELENFEVMRQNLEGTGAHLMHAAIWSESGWVGVENPSDESYAFRACSLAEEAPGSVRALSIATLLEEFGWDTVDLVKLDIEGAEIEVFRTASNWLSRAQTVVVELHERLVAGCEGAFAGAFKASEWNIEQHGEYMVARRIKA